MHPPDDVSLPPQEDFFLTAYFASLDEKQGGVLILILCWKNGSVSAEKNAERKTGTVIGKWMPAQALQEPCVKPNNFKKNKEKHSAILFIAFRRKMLYCIDDCSLFAAGRPAAD